MPLDRRDVLAGLTAAGTAALAGCTDYLPSAPGTTSRPDHGGWHTSFPGRVEELDLTQPSGTLGRFAYDPGVARHPQTRDLTYVLAASIEETQSSVSITVRDDVAWSNGDPLTGADVGRWAYLYRFGSPNLAPVPEIRDGGRRPRSPWEAITDVEWSDDTVTVRGRFDEVGSPLPAINAQLGRRPRAYYDRVWDAFQETFDDVPWETEQSFAAASDVVRAHAWHVGPELLPEGGIVLEGADKDGGREAAFSGLWYPYRLENATVEFRVNESHPFSDAVAFDRVTWTFHEEPQVVENDVRAGTVDGALGRDVTETLIERAPERFTAFPGPPLDITTIRLNHEVGHLGDRDVRAALQYAIDRSAAADSTTRAAVERVRTPGADLQSPVWLADDLRSSLRSYDHDVDRAAALLRERGFERGDRFWRTPDGDRFELQILTPASNPTLEATVVDALESFGVDASLLSLEGTSYRVRLDDETFQAARSSRSAPNAAGYRYNRASEYASPILRGNDVAEVSFLRDRLEEAVERSDGLAFERDGEHDARVLAYDDVEDLRAITVEAPPLGEPDGELREWPYLYHGAMTRRATERADRIAHAERCTWIYNYQVPELELLVTRPLVFHDTERWDVPDPDDPVWQYAARTTQSGGLFAALGRGRISPASND